MAAARNPCMQIHYIRLRTKAELVAISVGVAIAMAAPVPAAAQVIREAAGDVVSGAGRGARVVGRTAVRTAKFTGGAARGAGKATWRGGRKAARGTGRAVVTMAEVPVRFVAGAGRVITSPFVGRRGGEARSRQVPVRREPRNYRFPQNGPSTGSWKG